MMIKGFCPYRSGYTFLLVIIAIAIIALLYSMYFKGGFGKISGVDNKDNALPWTQEHRILEQDKPIAPPTAEQAEIKESLYFDLNAREGDQSRGEIRITIYQDGRVAGNWLGSYYEKKINFDILNGDFKGNIDSSNIFVDENGVKFPSRLYFIAKGSFLIEENDLKNKLAHRGGTIYVTGWLGSDYSIFGKITITSDKKYYEVFDFSADRPSKR